MQSIGPRWCQESHDQMVGGMPVRSEADFVAAKNQIYRGVQLRNVSANQVENGLLDLEANTFRAGQMPHDGIQPVARSSERVDNAHILLAGSWRDDLRNVASYRVTKRVLHRLKAGSRQYAHAPLPPM